MKQNSKIDIKKLIHSKAKTDKVEGDLIPCYRKMLMYCKGKGNSVKHNRSYRIEQMKKLVKVPRIKHLKDASVLTDIRGNEEGVFLNQV